MMLSDIRTLPPIRWFSFQGRNEARLRAAREALARAVINLDAAADLLDDVREAAEIEMMFGGNGYSREAEALRVASAEVRGIALPEIGSGER